MKSLNVGDQVNYHMIENGDITSIGHTIKHIEKQPNNFNCDVAWITGKSGCVDLDHLSLVSAEEDLTFRFNQRRADRNKGAVEIDGLWMTRKELQLNIDDFGEDDPQLKAACERGFRCYAARKEVD